MRKEKKKMLTLSVCSRCNSMRNNGVQSMVCGLLICRRCERRHESIRTTTLQVNALPLQTGLPDQHEFVTNFVRYEDAFTPAVAAKFWVAVGCHSCGYAPETAMVNAWKRCANRCVKSSSANPHLCSTPVATANGDDDGGSGREVNCGDGGSLTVIKEALEEVESCSATRAAFVKGRFD